MSGKKLLYLILLIGIIGSFTNLMAQREAKDQEWNSIILLRTSRLDIEKKFGEPDEFIGNEFHKLYKQKDYNIFVYYAEGCTDKENGDYNIPPRTITHLNVYFKQAIPISDSNIDKSKFKRLVYPSEIYLSNEEDGIRYLLSNDETSIFTISYSPKVKDRRLFCK